MTNSNSVEFFGNNDYAKGDGIYYGPRAECSDVPSDVDSLKTSANGWLIVFSETNYQGDWHKFPENSGSSKDDPAADLKKLDRGSDGNWKGKIRSYVLYGDRQYWDAFNGGVPPVPLDGEPTLFMMADGKYLSGPWTRYDGSKDYQDVRTDPGLWPNSFATGAKTWLTLFDQTGFQGNCYCIAADRNVPDTSVLSRADQGTWWNAVSSIVTSNSEPGSWTMSFDAPHFQANYSDTSGTLSGAGTAFTYRTQDAQYRLYEPNIGYPKNTEYQMTQQVDYLVSMATDVHVVMVCMFDDTGALVSVGYSWDPSETYAVPEWLVKTVDATVEIAGAVGAIETLGISEETAQFLVGVFDTACKVFDTVASGLARKSLDDGGQYYLVPVCCHAIVRLAGAQLKDDALINAQPATRTIAFSPDAFGTAISKDVDVEITTGTSGTDVTWLQWSETTGALNTYFEYTHDTYHWRSWHPETTLFPTGVGMLASCKVDFVRTPQEDDHILLLVGFLMDDNAQPKACFAQAWVQFGGEDGMDILGQPVTSGDVAQGVADGLSAIIDSDDFGNFFDSTDGRRDIPELAKMNINALIAAMSAS